MLQFPNILLVVMTLRMTLAAAPSAHVLFLIHSQDNTYHRQLGRSLHDDILRQAQRLAGDASDYAISVRMLHEIFNHPGDWTLLTAMPHLISPHANHHRRLLGDNTKWIIWCEESTHVRLGPLLARLATENPDEHFYLGHPLYDHEATIIHHFAYFENPKWFPYPMLRAGLVFTVPLFKRVASLVAEARRGGSGAPPGRTEFAIDAAHELARFIMDNVRLKNDKRSKDSAGGTVASAATNEASIDKDSALCLSDGQAGCADSARRVEKVILRRASYVCPRPEEEWWRGPGAKHQDIKCAMYAQGANMTACLAERRERIYFAVKTCRRYHTERLPIIEATWGPYAVHKRYFSDVADASIPTWSCGVANTETGHCAKTLAILKLAFEDIQELNRHKDNAAPGIRWLFLTDDDTLLSISQLAAVLGCYNASAAIYLGERYGYRVHAGDGFNYITGGGGIALSLPTVQLILQHCTCPTPSAPDDMILGSCLHTLQVPAIHSPRFHQARPNDYSLSLLQLEAPVSFHKFWQLDPVATYREWFQQDDLQLERSPPTAKHRRVSPSDKVRLQNASHDNQRAGKVLHGYAAKAGNDGLMQMESSLTAFDHTKEKHMDL